MNTRKIACLTGAFFIGGCLTASATSAFARSPRTVVVEAQRIDPSLQRRVSSSDLNLAEKPGQRTLKHRIFRTAGELCSTLNPFNEEPDCQTDAVHSTDDQVAATVARAERKMAGLPVGPAVSISMVLTAR